jgi:acyl-CoA hydrolase
MIVGIRVEALYPKTGQVSHTNSSYFTMVAKDENHETIQVPGLQLHSEEEIRRFYEGLHLKKLSKQKRVMLKSDFSSVALVQIKNELAGENCNFM